MNLADVEQLDWAKGDGLLPAVVQDARSGVVLMLGFMNRDALRSTLAEKRVTFWSRTRQRLWTKGETSGHWIEADSVTMDCDRDTLLVIGRPAGPVCHTGAADCFPDHPNTAATDGEEGLEVALAAVAGDDAQVVGESADLVFHLLLLLKSRGLSLREVVRELEQRHAAKS